MEILELIFMYDFYINDLYLRYFIGICGWYFFFFFFEILSRPAACYWLVGFVAGLIYL